MGNSDGIDTKRLVRTFIELIKINSPSYGEAAIGELLRDRLSALGCRVEKQKYGSSFNLIARKKGSLRKAPPLLLSAHMDTIEPTAGIRFSSSGKVIRSTGSTVLGADDKSAIAQILEALTVLKQSDIQHGDVEIVFTSAEEKGLFGARNLDYKKIRSRHALVLDSGGSVGKLVVAAPSHITYEMQITGRPAHAGIEPEKGRSAIRTAARIIAAVPDGRIGPGTTANIGRINGGTATNVVPKEVAVHGEVRSLDPAALRKTRDSIFSVARRTASRDRVKLTISENREYERFSISPDDPFLAFMDRTFSSCGIRPTHVATGGGSDANIFNQKGILAINISTGMQQVHSHEEYISVADLYKGSLVVLSAVRDFPQFGK